jgi:hypothetical protein
MFARAGARNGSTPERTTPNEARARYPHRTLAAGGYYVETVADSEAPHGGPVFGVLCGLVFAGWKECGPEMTAREIRLQREAAARLAVFVNASRRWARRSALPVSRANTYEGFLRATEAMHKAAEKYALALRAYDVEKREGSR